MGTAQQASTGDVAGAMPAHRREGAVKPPATGAAELAEPRHFGIETEDALRFLVDVGFGLAESLDYETTLTNVVHQAVPLLADWCALDLLDEAGALRRLAVAHPDPIKLALARHLYEKYPEDPNAPRGTHARIRSRQTEVVEDIPDELLVQSATDDEHLRILRELGLRSYISVPLVRNDVGLGVLTLVSAESGRRYTPNDVPLVEDLARRAALAIDHARAHREALDAASKLEQQALELELQAQQLQDQAAEMEAQQSELEMQTEELQQSNSDLLRSNDELAAANQRTREAEIFSRAIVESLTEPMVVYDAAWRARLVNAHARHVFQASGRAAALSEKTLWEEYPDLIGTGFEREMRKAADARRPHTFVEFRAATAAWSEVHCYPLPDGGLVVIWKDVTEQKRAEETLRYLSHASEIFASSFDYESRIAELAGVVVPELADWCAVTLVDGDGRLNQVAVAHVDPDKAQWARELDRRYPPDPDAATGVPQVIRTGEPELYADLSREVLEQSAVNDEHLRLLLQVGWVSAMVVPLEARGKILGAMTLVTSDSGRRYKTEDLELARELARRAALAVDNAALYEEAVRARDAAEQARRQAEDANQIKAAFLAHMSHELRTPLNAIGGYAELLQMGVRGAINEQQQLDVERIQRSQRHLLSLINDILNYAKIEAGRLQYDLKPVSVRSLVKDLEALVEPQLRRQSLAYSLGPVDPSLVASADAEKVEQILLNLLSNAIKFTPAGGAVSVSVASTGSTVEITVADTGVGIPADRLESVFEPFVQLAPFGNVPREGTGLGLAISRDLARGMGGDLRAESEPTVGSKFTVVLPVASMPQ